MQHDHTSPTAPPIIVVAAPRLASTRIAMGVGLARARRTHPALASATSGLDPDIVCIWHSPVSHTERICTAPARWGAHDPALAHLREELTAMRLAYQEASRENADLRLQNARFERARRVLRELLL